MAILTKVEATSSAGASLEATQIEGSQHESFREVEGTTPLVEGDMPAVEGDTPAVEGEPAAVEAVEADDKNIKLAKKINLNVGANFEKLSIMEKRMLNDAIEVHESIRQIKIAVDVYNHNVSDLNLFAAIVVRELNMFELAERRRLSADVKIGLVRIEDVKAIVAAKVEIVLLGVINQSLVELRHFNEMPTSASKVKEEPAMKRLKTNLEYLITIVVPFGLELKFLDGVEKTVEGTIARYNELSRTLFHLENYVIPCYNSEKPVMDLVEWDEAVEKYKLQARLSSSSSVEPASKRPCVQSPSA